MREPGRLCDSTSGGKNPLMAVSAVRSSTYNGPAPRMCMGSTRRLVYASPDGQHVHDDEQCADEHSPEGGWPVLRLSRATASSYDLEDCPDCRDGDPDPGHGLERGPEEYGAGDELWARTASQWFRGVVDSRYVRPADDVEYRAVCSTGRGYDFVVERMTSGRVRLERDGGISFNVREMGP